MALTRQGKFREAMFVSPEYFAGVFRIDVTNKQSGMRMKGREVALYTVADGKITSDQFLGFVPAS